MIAEKPNMFLAIGEVATRATELVQLEFRLARTELAEKALAVKSGLALVAAGAVFLAGALLLVLQFLVVALVDAGFSLAAATLVAVVLAVIVGCALIMAGRKTLDVATLTPRHTLKDLQRDSAMVKEKLS